MYYAVFLFQQAGIGGTQASLLANGLQGLVLNVLTWPDMYWMDTWGRRIPMIIGGWGMGFSMMIIAILMRTKGTKPRPMWKNVEPEAHTNFSMNSRPSRL